MFSNNKYLSSTRLTPAQERFVSGTGQVLWFGGQCGGGKSFALAIAAIEYACAASKATVLLASPGGWPHYATSHCRRLLEKTDVRYVKSKGQMLFPNGSRIHLYEGGNVYDLTPLRADFVGIDDVESFLPKKGAFIESRRTADGILRVTCQVAPDGVPLVPCRIDDNPHLDVATCFKFAEEYSKCVTKSAGLSILDYTDDLRTKPLAELNAIANDKTLPFAKRAAARQLVNSLRSKHE